MSRGRPFLLLLLLALATAGCTAPGADREGGAPAEATLTWGECPGDVEVTFVARHRCGTLTVPADRQDPRAGTVDLAVVKAWPQAGQARPGVAFTYGADVGTVDPVDGGVTVAATLLRRVVVEIEWRGVGPHGTPVLRCPEIEALRADLAAAATGDEQVEDAFVGAVAACGERLRADGIDPADYDTAAAVSDAEDLRRLVGAERWALNSSYGTQSRYLYAALAAHPDRLGPAYLDSPVPPVPDDLTLVAEQTRRLLLSLFRSCDRDAACVGDEPLADTWADALARVRAHPVVATVRNPAGQPVDVVLDDGRLLRAASYLLAGDHLDADAASDLPAAVRAAARGRMHPVLARAISVDAGLCVGYRPLCSGQDDFAWGVHLTQLCRDQLPFIDESRLERALRGDPTWEAVWGTGLWARVCDAWRVVPAEQAPPGPPVDPPVPMLLIPGEHDPFTDLAWARRYAASQDPVQLLEGAGWGHNVLARPDCIRGVRDAWAADPDAHVDAEACAAS